MADTERYQYALGPGIFGSSRLDLQYYQILQTYDNHLLDPVITYNTPGLKIADVCCGTGYFFINLKAHPSTKLHGFDIDFSKMPPESFLPNVKQHVWNINDPPPGEFISTFDIVNVQLVFTFVSDSSIDNVLSNILTILKPGGHIQWMESDARGGQCISPDPSHEPKYLPQIHPTVFGFYGLEPPSWPNDLDKVFTRNGVNLLRIDRRIIDPPNYRSWTAQMLTTFAEVSVMYWKLFGGTEEGRKKVEAFDELVRNCNEEAHVKGVAFFSPFIRVVGKKEADVQVSRSVSTT